MENYDINDCDTTLDYILYRNEIIAENGQMKERGEYITLDGEKLLLTIEGRLNSVAYTLAVDKHIEKSISDKDYYKSNNEFINDFQDGKYDSPENLNQVFYRTSKLYENQILYFVIVNGNIKLLEPREKFLKSIVTIYNNSLDIIDESKFKYLNDFIKYLSNENKKKRILKEGE